MNTDLETIENYFSGQLTPEVRVQFEAALRTETALAEAVAFYLMAKNAAQAEAQNQRRIELAALRKQPQTNATFWSVPMRWAAAASIILLLGLGWYFLRPQANTNELTSLTEQYVASHFNQLPATMDGSTSSVDSVKIGVGLFNEGRIDEAGVVFQDVLTRQPNRDTALKYAGIVSFRQGNYDKAITLFHQLSQQPDLIANPGTFYEALAYLKRNQPLDKSQAKKLLQEVITKNLDGKREADELVGKL